MQAHIEKIKQLILTRQKKEMAQAVQDALDAKVGADLILNQALIPAMDIVGGRFSRSEIFVPEMLVSANVMKIALGMLKPLLAGEKIRRASKIIICTVKGDLHDIGKNIVCMMLEGAGFEVVDLGVDVAPEAIIQKIKEEHPLILGLSALLSTTMPAMKEVVNVLESEGLRDSVKVVIGGAPVSQKYADQISADGYAEDAAQAVEVCRGLV